MTNTCGESSFLPFCSLSNKKIQILGGHIGEIVDSFCAQKQRRNDAISDVVCFQRRNAITLPVSSHK